MILICFLLFSISVYGEEVLLVDIPTTSINIGEWTISPIFPPPNQRIIAYLALKIDNTNTIENILLDISNPYNTRTYGKWLSKNEVQGFLKPSAESILMANRFLGDLMISSYIINNIIRVEMTVEQASKLFNTTFNVYKNGIHSIVRTRRIRVPLYLRSHLEFVGGIGHFPTLRKTRAKASSLRKERFGLAVTPRLIHDRYGTGDTRNRAANNSQAVAQFLGQHFWDTDLELFFTLFR